ncbi:MAG TPA: hypothetical protein VD969_06230 [Symbiobacteriaceae bacterium]|nr:hypothetical protein [Symbiobacteriaceae bacterium]
MTPRAEAIRMRRLKNLLAFAVSLVVALLLLWSGQQELAIAFGLYSLFSLILVILSRPGRS